MLVTLEENMSKIDKGFCLIYWKLSHRRRLIRTLYFNPIIAFLFLYEVNPDNSIFVTLTFTLVVSLVWSVQVIYEFTKYLDEASERVSERMLKIYRWIVYSSLAFVIVLMTINVLVDITTTIYDYPLLQINATLLSFMVTIHLMRIPIERAKRKNDKKN